MVAVGGHPYGELDGLQEPPGVDAAEYEAPLVECLGPLGARPDADRRDGPADGRVERALLGKSAAVAHDAERVHLQAVVVVEAKGLLHAHHRVQPEPRRLQPVAAPRVAAVQHRHIVLLRHGVDRPEHAQEVFLRVYVLLPVRAQQDVPALLQTEPGMHIGRLYLREVLPQDLSHRGARDIGALLRKAALGKVPPRVLRVGEVHIRDNVNYPAVGLLGKALVLAPVPRLHVEDRDVQPLSTYHAQAAVGVPEHQDGVRLRGGHQLVARIDDVAAGRTEVVPHGVHVDIRILQLQVSEEDTVKVVVVVLSRVREQHIEVLPRLVDDGGEADDLRSRPDDDQELYPPVVCEVNVRVVCLEFHVFHFFSCSTGSKYVSGRPGSKTSLAYITVTRSSVSERLMMLWV